MCDGGWEGIFIRTETNYRKRVHAGCDGGWSGIFILTVTIAEKESLQGMMEAREECLLTLH